MKNYKIIKFVFILSIFSSCSYDAREESELYMISSKNIEDYIKKNDCLFDEIMFDDQIEEIYNTDTIFDDMLELSAYLKDYDLDDEEEEEVRKRLDSLEYEYNNTAERFHIGYLIEVRYKCKSDRYFKIKFVYIDIDYNVTKMIDVRGW